LYHRKYKTLKHALEIITIITTKYKILNGDLESPENYTELQLETCVIPYNEIEKCSVCFENTTDTTVCGHSICLHCREKCILNRQMNCPMCRNENILDLYNNPMQLFNNRDSSDLHRIFLNTYHKFTYLNHEDEDEDEDTSSDEEEEEEEPVPSEPIINEFINDFVI
jgi:hypothetical protein